MMHLLSIRNNEAACAGKRRVALKLGFLLRSILATVPYIIFEIDMPAFYLIISIIN